MAKEKKAKGGLPNKNVHLRLAFLAQSAKYLHGNSDIISGERDICVTGLKTESQRKQARYLTTQMKGVGRKSVIRLSQENKQRICKVCDELLVDGRTATTTISNDSKGKKKPWADVKMITCNTCQSVKRFPIRQLAKEHLTPGMLAEV